MASGSAGRRSAAASVPACSDRSTWTPTTVRPKAAVKPTEGALTVDAQHPARVGLLVQLAEEIARERAGGHLTLQRFTTGWKVVLGTPDLDSGAGRHEVAALPAYPTLEAALDAFVITVPEM